MALSKMWTTVGIVWLWFCLSVSAAEAQENTIKNITSIMKSEEGDRLVNGRAFVIRDSQTCIKTSRKSQACNGKKVTSSGSSFPVCSVNIAFWDIEYDIAWNCKDVLNTLE